jgi:hypothetical protein
LHATFRLTASERELQHEVNSYAYRSALYSAMTYERTTPLVIESPAYKVIGGAGCARTLAGISTLTFTD